MSLTSHLSLPSKMTCAGYGCLYFYDQVLLGCLSNTNTWNTGCTPFMEEESFRLYAEIDICWKIVQGPSHLWSKFLLLIPVEIVLVIGQTLSPTFQFQLLLTPLSNFCFIDCCAAWRHLFSSDWILLVLFSQALTLGIHCLGYGILPYVGLFPEFSVNQNIPAEVRLLLLYKKLAVCIRYFQSSWWYRLKWNIYFLTSLLKILDCLSLLGWWDVDRCSHMPKCLPRSLVICEMKTLPWSGIMVFGVPWSFHPFSAWGCPVARIPWSLYKQQREPYLAANQVLSVCCQIY